MKFSIAFAVASTTLAKANALCGDYVDLAINLAPDQCNAGHIVIKLEEIYDTHNGGCSTPFSKDLKDLTNTNSVQEARDALDALCAAALASAAQIGTSSADWTAIENASVDLDDYFDGAGFLNTETGNFHQDADDLDADSFYYTGTDPRENDHYPTSEESYQAGLAVDSFLETAQTYYLNDPTSFSSCSNQAVMCCWHRDRQYKDNNGDCAPSSCFDQDPADNTDLCWTEDAIGNPTPYPGKTAEGDIHCHGFAWSELLDDVNSDARWNNLFDVAMHDHMYTRGYVQSITDDPDIDNVQPMCGCIEDMNPVARSDCTEAVPVTDYLFTTDSNSVISIAPQSGTYRIEFQACEGYIYKSTILPENYENHALLQAKNNDLSAFVFRLYLEQKLSLQVMDSIFDVLVGYKDPNLNNNQLACKQAYEDKFQGQTYPNA